VPNRRPYAGAMRWMMIIPLCLSGCGLVPERWSRAAVEADAPVLVSETSGDVTRPQARPNVAAGARVSVPENGALGATVASLGNAAEPGLWLKTPLVQQQAAGRAEVSASGNSVAVTLIPIEGPATAGSRLSLQAMQALGVGLTDLVELRVFAGS